MKTNTRLYKCLLLSFIFLATLVTTAFSATAVERECRYEDFTFTATPDKGVYGEEVNLSVSASNLPENGLVYQWLKWGIDDASGREAFVPISITTEGNLTYSIDQDTTTIIVVAEACVAKVQIKEITLSLEPIDRECNDIILQPIVKLGVDEPISYKWQRSTDGITWEDLDPSAVEPVEIEGLEGCVKVTISETSMFRLAEVDASGAETGLYSDVTELYELENCPSDKPSDEPTDTPSDEPVDDPTDEPSDEPVEDPKDEPSDEPVDDPTDEPSDEPVEDPKDEPSDQPSDEPVEDPKDEPSEEPEEEPTEEPSYDIVWPTVFTPMVVDGYNDDFVMGLQPAVALKIFDRYGNLVRETSDGWDGRYSTGEYAMPGVYYYIATLSNGDIVKGNVELLNEE